MVDELSHYYDPARQVEDKSSLKNPCLYIIPRIISTFASQFMPTQEGRMEKGHAPGRAASFNLKAKEYPFYQERAYPTNLLTLQNNV